MDNSHDQCGTTSVRKQGGIEMPTVTLTSLLFIELLVMTFACWAREDETRKSIR